MIAEKDECLRQIDEMLRELEVAKPGLKPEHFAELATRIDWLREFAICAEALDESLWRYRYLRHQSEMLTTDPSQVQFLARANDVIQAHRGKLFRIDPGQKFWRYSVPLGELPKPSLGSPVTLMRELYDASRACVESATGPDALPAGPPHSRTPPAPAPVGEGHQVPPL